MTEITSQSDAWDKDQLGFEKIGLAFTNLIQSIDTEKVISIEAGFGRGKTFFRKAWAKQLQNTGEVVVEVDVQQSDHSGDPVITLLGALVGALPNDENANGKAALESVKKYGAIGARALTRAVLKAGADEVFEVMTEGAIDRLEDFDSLDGVIKEVGNEMSKVAGQLIASQMAAEKVRKTELPKQLEALRAALVKNTGRNRVVIIIDELDRCHPDYAISFLESTKLIFGQSGFVFCLMVNADYLENLASHRFGVSRDDERYLDKFVDIRLKLEPEPDVFKRAIYELACELPLKIPFGTNEAFSIKSAAKLASELALQCGFSMRKTKRILLKVEVAMRCYAEKPLDASLLIFMAFRDESPSKVLEEYLPRSFFTPEEGRRHTDLSDSDRVSRPGEKNGRLNEIVYKKAPELLDLPSDRYYNPENNNYYPWAWVFLALAPHYIPDHRRYLDVVASILVNNE